MIDKDQNRKTIIIAIEGIDGSGKTLQWERLIDSLEKHGKSVKTMSFPNYDGFFGSRCGDLLRGDEIRADQVDSKSMCLWYALDRWDSFKNFRDGENDYLLINRFTLSNAVYQSIRNIDQGIGENWDWVRRLEQGELSLPEPDLYLIMDVDPLSAQKNVDQKNARDYVDGRDVYEEQEDLLSRARQRYLDIAAKGDNFEVIRCMEAQSEKLREPELIAVDIWNALAKRGLIK